ncbi:hypothetical protein ACF0H5_010418 [Mactra antiquata]
MKRDVLRTKIQGTNVSAYQIGNSSRDLNTSFYSATVFDKTSQSDYNNNTDNRKLSVINNQFYNSYDPEVGINTATVLGGILIVLVIYVIYRTKCRKRILKIFQNCTMKYFPEEFPDLNQKPDLDKSHSSESHWISENAKMIWQERTHLSQNRETIVGAAICSNETDSKSLEKEAFSTCINTCGMQQIENKSELGNYRPQLPDYEGNIEQATAHWVQNVKSMDLKERQLNGIILKIPPELVSHNAKIRSHFHSVTDYGDHNNDTVNLSKRNKSLPSLVEQQLCLKTNYASNSPYSNTKSSHLYVPLATEEDDSLDIPTNQLVVPYQTGSRIPIDICPIVKVQHYHSRSKRRLTSLSHSSTDDISSSSEEHRLLTKADPVSASQAKYMRLADTDHDSNDMHLDETDLKYSRVNNADCHGGDMRRFPVKPVNDSLSNQCVKSLETNL